MVYNSSDDNRTGNRTLVQSKNLRKSCQGLYLRIVVSFYQCGNSFYKICDYYLVMCFHYHYLFGILKTNSKTKTRITLIYSPRLETVLLKHNFGKSL